MRERPKSVALWLLGATHPYDWNGYVSHGFAFVFAPCLVAIELVLLRRAWRER
jgi:hypothetical protein